MLEEVSFSAKNIAKAKLRSFLTVLGIIVGVAIVVSMLSIGEGMEASISEQLEALGGDKIVVSPKGMMQGGGFQGPPAEFLPFGEGEIRAIEVMPRVEEVVALFYRPASAEYRGDASNIYVAGIEEPRRKIPYFHKFYTLKEGRFYSDESLEEVDLGYRVAYNLFDSDVRVGDMIKVKGRSFKVVGILEEIGNTEDDSTIYMSMKGGRDLFDAGDEVTMMWVVAEEKGAVGVLAEKIEDELEKLRGAKDFDVLTQEQMAEQVERITSIITFVLGGIASISLVVGGVIIMNTMLTSVLERTREIGVMKAVGATDARILKVFMAEAGLLGLIGGIAGLALGSAISQAIQHVGRMYIGSSFQTLLTAELAAIALGFSLAIGVLSGLYPAYRAAKLSPIEALRYE